MGDNEQTAKVEDGATDAPLNRLVICITIFWAWSVAVSIVHALWPSKFDLTSVVIAEIAIAPVLIFLFHNIEAGFGEWKLALRPFKVRSAFAKVDSLTVMIEELAPITGTASTAQSPATTSATGTVSDSEPPVEIASTSLDTAPDDLLFVRLRREIEKRLRNVARAYSITDARITVSSSKLINYLISQGIIGKQEGIGIKDLISAGAAQAHGLPTPPGIAEFARNEGDRLLGALDNLALKPEVALLNKVLEKAGVLEEPILYLNHGVDLVVPGEVAFELQSGAPSKILQSTSMAKMLKLIGSNIVKAGILVLSKQPEGVEDGQDLDSDYALGFAWTKDDGFAGDALARKVAPWLFS
jgi:hypothetical protein